MKFDQSIDQVEAREKRAQRLAAECRWNGEEILALAYHALTDANFHTEAQRLADLMDELFPETE